MTYTRAEFERDQFGQTGEDLAAESRLRSPRLSSRPVRILDESLQWVDEFEAYDTATPGIVVCHMFRAAYPQGIWSVMVESCGVRMGWAKTLRGATLLAGAYGGIPIKWTAVPQIQSANDRDRVVGVIRERLDKSPELLRWLGLMNLEGAE